MQQAPLTISQLHQKKLAELAVNEAKLPGLREELSTLRYDLGIIQRKHNEIRARNIQAEIDSILTARDKYYLTGVPLMSKAKNDDTAYNRFRSFVDPSYTFTVSTAVNDDNYCYSCKEFRVVISYGVAVCPKCCTQVYADLSVEGTKRNVFKYKRLDYLRRWIEQIQGKEYFAVPKNVIDTVKSEIVREGKIWTVNESDIVRYLKSNKLKLYDHCTKILAIVTGVKPLRMTREMEVNLEGMFESVQESYERHKGKRRKFFSYAYILYKMCELLGYTEFLPKLFMHKKKKLVDAQDDIWRMVCDDVGLEFIRTVV